MVRVLRSVLLVVLVVMLGFIASSNVDATGPSQQNMPAGKTGGSGGNADMSDGDVDGNLPPKVLEALIGNGK